MARQEKTWVLVLAFLFFAVPFVVMLVMVLLGELPLASNGGALMLLCGGFTVAGIAALVPSWRHRPAGAGIPAAMWALVLAGLALWCLAPLALAAQGGWSASVGGGGRAVPAWILAPITWGVTVLAVVALIRQRRRGRRG